LIGDSDGIGSFEGTRLKVIGLDVSGAERLAEGGGTGNVESVAVYGNALGISRGRDRTKTFESPRS